jgi:hypothetical protein
MYAYCNVLMDIIPENVKHGADTAINGKAINLLAADGWQLLLVMNTGKTEGMRASVPNLLYYFKKE